MPHRDIWIEKSSKRKFHSLQSDIRERIAGALETLTQYRDPLDHPKVTVLSGPEETTYRLRVGEFRVVFTLDHGRILIHRVGRRKSIYDGINNVYDEIEA